MKAILSGLLLAVCLAAGAAFVLNSQVQQSAGEHYRSDAVRL